MSGNLKIRMAVSDTNVPLGALVNTRELEVTDLSNKGATNLGITELTYPNWRNGLQSLTVKLPVLPEKHNFFLTEVDVRGCGLAADVLQDKGIQLGPIETEYGRQKAFFLLILPYGSYNQISNALRAGGITALEFIVSNYGSCIVRLDSEYMPRNSNLTKKVCVQFAEELLNIIKKLLANDSQDAGVPLKSIEKAVDNIPTEKALRLKVTSQRVYDHIHYFIAREFVLRSSSDNLCIQTITPSGNIFLKTSQKEAYYYYCL